MTDTDDLLAPIPRPHVRFNLDTTTTEGGTASSASPSPTPSASSSTSSILPPPTSSNPVAPFSASASRPYSDADESSGVPLRYSYSEHDSDEALRPIASGSSGRQRGGADDPDAYYPPKPLASNISSRETQFDLDTDELDTDEYDSTPLIEGLLDHPRAKRGSLDLRGEDRRLKALERDAEAHEPPDWLTRGGGVWAGIANMSNSILGAGIIGQSRDDNREKSRIARKLKSSVADDRSTLVSGHRTAVRAERGRSPERYTVAACSRGRDGLDDQAHRSKCENEWTTELYRYHG